MTSLLLASLLLAPAHAADTVSGDAAMVAEYRHQAFEGLAKHMKALSMATKGQVTLPKADLVVHATAIQGVSQALPAWFPAGTGPDKAPKTEALAAIWSDAAGFQAATEKFQAAAADLVKTAEAGDASALGGKLKAVGMSCGNCHDSFRKDDH